jgi:hypothetical protein
VTSRRVAEPHGRSSVVPAAFFATASVALVAWMWWMGRGFGLFSDEWNVTILANRGRLLEPFNGHLTLVPQLLYLGLSRAVGLQHYGAYRAVGLTSYVGLAALAAWHAGRRSTPWLGALVGASMLWSSAGELTVLFPLLVNFTIPACAGIAIWLLLERPEPHDVLGAALLAVALASSAVGVVVAVAVGVELVARRVGLRRLLPYAVPVALWAAWWFGFHTSAPRSGGLGALVSFAWDEAFASFAALAGHSTPGGAVVLAAFATVVVASLFRWRSFDARAASALAGFGAFVVLTALGRQGLGVGGNHLPSIPPAENRYLFVNDLFLLSAVAAMVGPALRRAASSGPELDLDRRRLARAALVVGALGLVAANGVSLGRQVADKRDDQLVYQRSARTYLLGAELAGSRADRGRVLPINFISVTTGAYLGLVARTSSPLPGQPDLSSLGTAHDRQQADAWLIADLGLRLEPPGPGTLAAGPCLGGSEAPSGSTVVVRAGLGPTGSVGVRRLAGPGDATTLGTLAPGEVRVIHLPPDPRPGPPWHIDVSGAAASVEVCT